MPKCQCKRILVYIYKHYISVCLKWVYSLLFLGTMLHVTYAASSVFLQFIYQQLLYIKNLFYLIFIFLILLLSSLNKILSLPVYPHISCFLSIKYQSDSCIKSSCACTSKQQRSLSLNNYLFTHLVLPPHVFVLYNILMLV